MGTNGNGNGKRFWTAKEAAEYLGLTTYTLYSYCREIKPRAFHINVPPFRRIGRVFRFPVEEFKEWANRFDNPTRERK